MGRAIVRDPSVFLFDEPLSNLDAQLRGHMRTEIKRLHQSIGTTIVYVTHDQVEAMTLADRIVIMRDGRIEQIGTPLEVFHAPASTFVAGFICTPTMNLLDLPVVVNDLAAGLPSPPTPSDVAGRQSAALGSRRQVTAGLRPDHLTIAPGKPTGHAAADTFKGEVVIAEPLGNTTQVIVRVGNWELVGMADGRFVPSAGETVDLRFDASTGSSFRARWKPDPRLSYAAAEVKTRRGGILPCPV